MPDEKNAKAVVLAKYPEAHAYLNQDAGYVILSDKTEDAILLGYYEKTKDEAWESTLRDIEEGELYDADYAEYADSEDEDEEDDD